MFCVENFGCVGNSALVSGGGETIMGLIVTIINLLLILGFIAGLVFLIYGGIKWITSSGDKQGLANAPLTITYAFLGVILTMVSFVIIRLISGFFQLDLGLGIPTGPRERINRYDLLYP